MQCWAMTLLYRPCATSTLSVLTTLYCDSIVLSLSFRIRRRYVVVAGHCLLPSAVLQTTSIIALRAAVKIRHCVSVVSEPELELKGAALKT